VDASSAISMAVATRLHPSARQDPSAPRRLNRHNLRSRPHADTATLTAARTKPETFAAEPLHDRQRPATPLTRAPAPTPTAVQPQSVARADPIGGSRLSGQAVRGRLRRGAPDWGAVDPPVGCGEQRRAAPRGRSRRVNVSRARTHGTPRTPSGHPLPRSTTGPSCWAR
jgi:hypothetical protein